jgi:hypothetical protein
MRGAGAQCFSSAFRPPGIRGLLRQHDGAVERHAGCAQHDQRGPDEGRVELGVRRGHADLRWHRHRALRLVTFAHSGRTALPSAPIFSTQGSSAISIISSTKSSARSSRTSVYSSRNSLWRAIQRKTVALPGIPASLQMARRFSPSASRSQIDMASWAL